MTPRRTAAPPETPTPYESENEYSYIADVPSRPSQASASLSQEPPKYFELDPEENKRLPQAMVRVNDRYVFPNRGSMPVAMSGPPGSSNCGAPVNYAANYDPRVCMGMPSAVQAHPSAVQPHPQPSIGRRVLVPVSQLNPTGQKPDVLSATTTHNMPLCVRVPEERHLTNAKN